MKLRNLLSERNDGERAVSPVIGVILMVAITVILAAVIGTFVLGMGDDINRTATAGVSASDDDRTATLNSLGSGAEGIICSDKTLDTAGNDEYTTQVGQSIDCTSDADSVVAYSESTDVENATVYTFN